MLDTAVIDESGDWQLEREKRSNFGAARPRPGKSLGALILAAQRPVRAAVAELAAGQNSGVGAVNSLFECTLIGRGAVIESPEIRLAWLLVNACVLHARKLGIARPRKLVESTTWFFGGAACASTLMSGVASDALVRADAILESMTIDENSIALFTYMAEPYGHVSRSCLLSEQARSIRMSKKADGVYYTPADVSEFLVSSLRDSRTHAGAWLDPACGTGVFLRSVLANAIERNDCTKNTALSFAYQNIFGIDKSALATDSCAFTLMLDLEAITFEAETPFNVWARLKQNIACMDATALVPSDEDRDLFERGGNPASLSGIFGPRGISFRFLVMNPPYAGAHKKGGKHGQRVRLAPSATAHRDLHLDFMEMMWRIDGIEAAGAVLPLSVATNTTKNYKAVRTALLQSSGRKELLLFDREPQALFGEDIKTRNAIVFRFACGKSQTFTSSLLKWTAPQRPGIFTRGRLVAINPDLCATFLPKLGSTQEAKHYTMLAERRTAGAADLKKIEQAPEIFRACLNELSSPSMRDSTAIAIASTAYNFLNCFSPQDIADQSNDSAPLSSSPNVVLRFTCSETAAAAYALLTSRLSYWLWRVEGDGFHVTSEFLQKLPLWHLLDDITTRTNLARHGLKIRNEALVRVTRSLNSGRRTYSFHCPFGHPSVKAVEKIVLTKIFGDYAFASDLDRALEAAISVDGSNRRPLSPFMKSIDASE